MRFEELTYRSDGSTVTLGLHSGLTVIAGLDSPARREWIERCLGSLHGAPPGYDTTSVLGDESGRRIRLTRDPGGVTGVVDPESGQDLAAELAPQGGLDWLALLGLDPVMARAVMVVESPKGETAGATARDEALAEARAALVRLEGECARARAQQQSGEEEWRQTVAALEGARAAFGGRPRLESSAVERGLLLPVESPPGLDELHRAYLATARNRAEAQARLDESGPPAATPSAPWVTTLARLELADLWRRAEDLRSARIRAAEVANALEGSGSGDIIARIEAAHSEVETAERRMGRVRFPNPAARRALARAQKAEQEILASAGFESWLGFQLRRVSVLTEAATLERLRAAETELQRAIGAWTELAGEVDVETALNSRHEVETRAARLALTDSSANEAATKILEAAETAYQVARTALLAVCSPFAVEPGRATEEIAALVAEANHARLQRALEEAEATEEAARKELDVRRARASDLVEYGDALRHRLSVLEASNRPLTDEDPEMALLGRFAVARRVGPRAEPVPLIVDDAFVGYPATDKWSLLELVARLGEATQVIYLTDDPETGQWAEMRSRQGDLTLIPAVSPAVESPPPPDRPGENENEDAPAPGGCELHSEQQAVASCRGCGRKVCSLCFVPAAGDLCTECAFARARIRPRSRPAPGDRRAGSRRH